MGDYYSTLGKRCWWLELEWWAWREREVEGLEMRFEGLHKCAKGLSVIFK